MQIFWLQGIGLLVFILGTLVAGIALRAKGWAVGAQSAGQVLFVLGLLLPQVVGVVWPGLDNFDGLLGTHGLGFTPYLQVLGAILLVLGITLLVVANRALARGGNGLLGLGLPGRLVVDDVYARMRHPLALGYYLILTGAALAADSRVLLAGAVVLTIPAHLFYLRFVEEPALARLHGAAYQDYQARAPFVLPEG